MTIDLDLYRKINGSYGVQNKREDIIINTQKYMLEDFHEHPSYFQVEVNNETRDVLITEQSSLTRKPDIKLIILKPNEDISLGDNVAWKDKIWLCVDKDFDDTVYIKGVISVCNNTLTFQNESLETISIPCILIDKSSVYATGIDSNKYLTLADDQILITVPNNEETSKLDHNKRFIFNNHEDSIYELTKINRLTQPGLLNLTMTKTQKNDNDRLDLNLADYIDPSTEPVDPTPEPIGYSITIEGNSSIEWGNTSTYTSKVYADGVLVEKDVTWSIDNASLATIASQTGTSCIVEANSNFNLGTVKLKATLIEDVNVFVEKDIEIRSLF